MDAQMVTRARTTDRAMASGGRLVTARAAAGGPTMREKVSRAPTTGTVRAVAAASTSRNSNSIRGRLTPRASATSGTVEDSSSGRYRMRTATRLATASPSVGSSSPLDTPRMSPNNRANSSGSYSPDRLSRAAPMARAMTRARAVTASWRPRRPRPAIMAAEAPAKTARPSSGSTPARLAAAAPVKALLGMAWAGNDEPRSTTKKPTTPAITAIMVPASQVLVIKEANTSTPSVGPTAGGEPGEQVDHEGHGHDEEADR